MKFYIALFLVVIYNSFCSAIDLRALFGSASLCKHSTKLWLCTNGTATFDEENFQKVRYCKVASRSMFWLVAPKKAQKLKNIHSIYIRYHFRFVQQLAPETLA